MSLQEKQALLLQQRDEALKSLGLTELHHEFEKVSSAAKRSLGRGATKRKSPTDASAEPSAPMRRSGRVAGLTATAEVDAAAVVAVADPDKIRPVGDLPWNMMVHAKSTTVAEAAELLDALRANTAKLIGLPQPSPLREVAATAAGAQPAVLEEQRAAVAAALPTTSAAAADGGKGGEGGAEDVAAAASQPKGRRSTRAAAAAASPLPAGRPQSAAASPVAPHSSGAAADAAPGPPTSAADSSSSATAAVFGYVDAGIVTQAALGAHHDVGVWPAASSRAASRLTQLRLGSELGVMKVMPERIYSIGFHPGSSKLLALAGDKWGHLGVWDTTESYEAGRSASSSPPSSSAAPPAAAAAGSSGSKQRQRSVRQRRSQPKQRGASSSSSAAADGDDGGDDDVIEVVDEPAEDEAPPGAACVATFKPHTSPVNYFQIPIGAPHLVVSSAYDGSLRALDLNRGVSLEVCSGLDDEHGGVSAFDCLSAGLMGEGASHAAVALYGGCYSGSCFSLDFREDPQRVAPRMWAAHDKKVTALSVLRGSHTLLTASSDRRILLWDMRKLPTSGASAGGAAAAKLGLIQHPLAISSAFFATHGEHVVSTCTDNYLRVWDVKPSKSSGGTSTIDEPPRAMIAHDNQTGRWLTQFRTVFDPACDDTFIVGAMNRTLEIYSASQGKRLAALSSEYITAVPTLNAVHPDPNIQAIVSGTASGRMYLWS